MRVMIKQGLRVSQMLALLLAMVWATAQAQGLPDFVPLVERYSPAVVNISTTRNVAADLPQGHPPLGMLPEGLPEDGPFGDLLRRFFGEGGGGMPPQGRDSTSLGSGFIISADGYVVTNHHVIADADEIQVRLSDRRTYDAELVGSDPSTDVALLRIQADNLPVLRLGDSSDLKVGEWVLAIGSPFGFDHSVTAGIVSAKGRSLPSENYVPFIQTDVAINPGNSGGPLFNLQGEVVGINSQIFSRTGGFMGLSFAIPIEVAADVVAQLKETGSVDRGWLGVIIQEVTRELAESFGMDRPSGALVARVLPDSPAEKAGIQAGDVIMKFNGEEVPRSSALPPIVGRSPIGQVAQVDVLRDGEAQTIGVRIEALPDDSPVARAQPQPPKAEPTQVGALGMTLQPVPDQRREQLELPEGGVLVAALESGIASRAGIRRGDILLMVNNQALESPQQASDVLTKLPAGRTARVLVQRSRGPVWLALEIPE
ncbi:serine protease Do [Ectothiorhodosinus mongolicus]|uniref:Probable periplasmic serine endoprotease DegP-like n=1 Tax=Ectothiorhodosinus mongolicus TaxID=233100 RepID=A0A1R3VMT5_9GAMM|nr:serine protease Do [Ectothiorhodosinus mongolicus]